MSPKVDNIPRDHPRAPKKLRTTLIDLVRDVVNEAHGWMCGGGDRTTKTVVNVPAERWGAARRQWSGSRRNSNWDPDKPAGELAREVRSCFNQSSGLLGTSRLTAYRIRSPSTL